MFFVQQLTLKNLETLFPNYKHKISLERANHKRNEILNKKRKDNDLNDKDYFLSIGRLTKQKNYVLLLNLIKN